VAPQDGHGQHRHLQRAGESKGAGTESLEPAIVSAPGLGKDHDGPARLEQTHRLPGGARVGRFDLDREGPQPAYEPGEPGNLEQRVPGHEVHGEANGNADEDWVGKGDVIRSDDQRPIGRDVFGPLESDSPVEPRPEMDDGSDSVQDGRAHTLSVPWRL
jgi:hypothetical protein